MSTCELLIYFKCDAVLWELLLQLRNWDVEKILWFSPNPNEVFSRLLRTRLSIYIPHKPKLIKKGVCNCFKKGIQKVHSIGALRNNKHAHTLLHYYDESGKEIKGRRMASMLYQLYLW